MPDGRFAIEIVGVKRFKILRTSEQDGYRVAQPSFFSDELLEEGSQGHEEAKALAAEVDELAMSFLEKLRCEISRDASVGGHNKCRKHRREFGCAQSAETLIACPV